MMMSCLRKMVIVLDAKNLVNNDCGRCVSISWGRSLDGLCSRVLIHLHVFQTVLTRIEEINSRLGIGKYPMHWQIMVKNGLASCVSLNYVIL